MDKILFTPISIGSGLVAGLIGRKLFAALWGVVDDEEAPKPEHRRVQPVKLVAALAIEGALFALIRGLVDHGSRHAYLRLTGEWPGDEEPEEK
jgi:Protein of unknown function (DUF4235)